MNDPKKIFLKRYFSFYAYFYKKEPDIAAQTTASRYYDKFAYHKIPINFVINCMDQMEDMWTTLDYTFNIVAYIRDWWVAEKEEKRLADERKWKTHPIPKEWEAMPDDIEPEDLTDKPNVIKNLKLIKKKNPDMYRSLMKIGWGVKQRKPHLCQVPGYCHSCRNTGWIVFTIFYDESGRRQEKVYEVSDIGGSIAKICLCPMGDRIYEKSPSKRVTREEMELASMI